MRPDIVLIHLGTNDVFSKQSTDSTVRELGQIIDALRAANPCVAILLAQIISAAHRANTAITALNAHIPELAAAKTTAQSPVIVVDQYTGFDAQRDTYDGVHPNALGERKIAQAWYAALKPLLATGHSACEDPFLKREPRRARRGARRRET